MPALGLPIVFEPLLQVETSRKGGRSNQQGGGTKKVSLHGQDEAGEFCMAVQFENGERAARYEFRSRGIWERGRCCRRLNYFHDDCFIFRIYGRSIYTSKFEVYDATAIYADPRKPHNYTGNSNFQAYGFALFRLRRCFKTFGVGPWAKLLREAAQRRPIPRSENRGSKYPIFKDPCPQNHSAYGILGPEFLNVGYLDHCLVGVCF